MIHRGNRRALRRGYTLVEVMIALAVFGIALLAILMIVPALSRNVDEEIINNDLRINLNRVVGEIADNVRPGLIPFAGTHPSVGNTFVKYLVPVDRNDDGFFMVPRTDAFGNTEMVMTLGGRHPDAPGHGFPYRVASEAFVNFAPEDEADVDAIPRKDYQFYEVVRFKYGDKTFSEAEYQIDVDGDGEFETVFELGSIELYYPPAAAPDDDDGDEYEARRVQLCGDIILWDPNENRHLPNMFEYEDDRDTTTGIGTGVRTLLINLTALDISPQNHPFFVNVTTRLALRNQNQAWDDPNHLP